MLLTDKDKVDYIKGKELSDYTYMDINTALNLEDFNELPIEFMQYMIQSMRLGEEKYQYNFGENYHSTQRITVRSYTGIMVADYKSDLTEPTRMMKAMTVDEFDKFVNNVIQLLVKDSFVNDGKWLANDRGELIRNDLIFQTMDTLTELHIQKYGREDDSFDNPSYDHIRVFKKYYHYYEQKLKMTIQSNTASLMVIGLEEFENREWDKE